MPQPTIVDSHCHLDFPDFEDDLPEIITRAQDAGVRRMVTICTALAHIKPVQMIAERYEPVYFAAANHPMNVAKQPMATVQQLVKLADHPKMVAIGETGLDYHYTSESMDRQQDSLRIHIQAAQETGLPLIIHARDADQDMARILSEEHKSQAFTCVMHCFSSSPALGQTALDLGFYLSMSGITTFKKSQELRDFFRTVPLDRILVETDAPYLAPTPHRGKRNEPAFTAFTAKNAAELFNLPYADFAAQTTANFHRLFQKTPVADSSV